MRGAWTASTDAENNLEGHIIERSTNGGSSWPQIYTGSNLSFTDTITRGWTSVAYRVKAIDGAAQRTFKATPGETYTFMITGETFMKVLNGNHTLTIAAQVTDLQMALCDVYELAAAMLRDQVKEILADLEVPVEA